MPQREKLSWVKLRIGLLVIVSLTILAVGIFFISGQVGGFLTSRYELKTYFPSAQDLRNGAEVDLAGLPVGNVSTIHISSLNDPNRAVEVDMKISKKYQSQIRTDSSATIETVGLLGQSYVDISLGRPEQPMIPPGGIVPSHVAPAMKQIVQNTNDVISNLRVLSAQITDITSQIQHGRGTIGQLIYTDTLSNRLNQTVNSVQDIVERVNKGQGTLGKLITDDTLYDRLNSTVNSLSQVVDEVQHGNGSLAKLMNDPTVYNNLKDVTARADTLVTNINEGKGTLGKLATNPQLYNRMNSTLNHVDEITARIDAGQGTLGKLSTDPSLFNNLNESSISLKDFLTQFRKNPKKYLTLRLHIF